jgi:cysteine desulfurase
MDTRPIYLDYNATSPCSPEAVAAMLPFLAQDFGNPSSVHFLGRKAARAVYQARTQVARSIKATQEEIYFTSGATESNNIVLLGPLTGVFDRKKIVVAAIEHKSVLEPCRWLAGQGYEIVELPVTAQGVIDLSAAENLIDEQTSLVCVQAANNEIGTVQPVRMISGMAHRRGALVHCDASQVLGKCPTSVADLDVDTASFSSHKAYGPKGIGVLFVRSSVRQWLGPVYRGGGQESEIRPGTLNVPGIVGFGVACETALGSIEDDSRRVTTLRDRLEQGLLTRCSKSFVIGTDVARLPNTTNVCFGELSGDAILAQVPLLCAGLGSACSSGSISPSHVLLACGLTREQARGSVRFSLGRYTTEDEVFSSIDLVAEAVNTLNGLI